jgi:aryl-alcohol dehydrogenase-like predicted oxidoreductase
MGLRQNSPRKGYLTGRQVGFLPFPHTLGKNISSLFTLRPALSSFSGFRSHLPRFQGQNLKQNLALVEALATFAATKSVSVEQLAIAWVLSRGQDIVPLVGARRRDSLQQALGSLELVLTEEDSSKMEALISAEKVAGERYMPEHMAMLDSERPESRTRKRAGF